MQGSDYDTNLVAEHETGWQHWTKFMLWSVLSIAVLLLLLVAFLM
ncbi:aa3-type cytochrome c oxidase subunit IV [Thalassospira australica]|nr:aa3-type cytochrome c oxidase subunit IV [Thalassospira australica]